MVAPNMTIKLIGRRIAVLPPADATLTASGIYVGPEFRPLRGKIHAVSPECAQLGLQLGMSVHFGRRSGHRVPGPDNQELVILSLEEILAYE